MYIPTSAIATSLSLLSVASAFYPVHPVWPATRRRDATLSAERSGDLGNSNGIVLPLYRTLVRRDNKYKIVVSNPPKQPNSVGIDQEGTDMSYVIPVKLGASSKQYRLLLDSAASNTWVMGQDCMSPACGTHNTFGPADSSTLVTSNTPFEVTYGTGSVSGHVVTDNFRISSFSPTFQFGIANNVSDDFNSYPMDGILGVGRGDNIPNTIEAPSLLDVLSAQQLIKSKLFGVWLSRASDNLQDGELNFGEPNKDRFDGALNFLSVEPNDFGFWQISLGDTAIDGKKFGIQSRSAVIDTGTSFILMPPDEAAAMHKMIPGSTQSGETFSVPCKASQVLQLTFNGVTYNVTSKDYLAGELGNGLCKSQIIARKTFGDGVWLVGDVFLKNVYSVYDADNSKVGFGVKANAQPQSIDSSKAPSSTSGISSTTGTSVGTSPTLPATKASETTKIASESQQTPKSSPTKGAATSLRISGLLSALLALMCMIPVLA